MNTFVARLDDRALVAVNGPDAEEWLQGLVTQTVTGLDVGQMRSAAFLTPQGRLLFDFIVQRREDGLWLDVDAGVRGDLVARLGMYKLRAQATVATIDGDVLAGWGGGPKPDGAGVDPRQEALGWRLLGEAQAPAVNATVAQYTNHRRGLGVAETAADGLADRLYAIEANLDLLNGIDFHKGCFIGQETTSRMKRRNGVRSRMLPFSADGAAAGDEILNGELRAGEVLTGGANGGLALMRLDRCSGTLTANGRPVELISPDWMPQEPPSTGQV
jgi:hypothetical protein